MGVLQPNNLRGISRRDFLSQMLGAQAFDLSSEEITTYFDTLKRYVYANAPARPDEYPYVKSLSSRQRTCSQSATRKIILHDFEGALHEMLDVLDDLNSNAPLTYSEFVLLDNLFLLFEWTRDGIDLNRC